MSQLTEQMQQNWFPLLLLLIALAAAAMTVWRQRKKQPALGWLLTACVFLLLGAGGWLLAESAWAMWLAVAAFIVLILMLAVLVLSGNWSAILGCLSGSVLLLGVGGMICPVFAANLERFGTFLLSLTPLQPWWLLLLMLIPLVIWLSSRSLAGLGPVRRWLVIGFRCAAIALLVLALTEAQARRNTESLTVMFLWDQSLSIPQELDEEHNDLRKKRILKFINDAVSKRGPAHHEDHVGLIVFGQWPRLELPPAQVEKLNYNKIAGNIDRTHTDIAAAVKLALASFPEGTNKRIVLISDGNENLGDVMEQAEIAKQNGVQIDVVPLATSREQQQEIVVLKVVAPAHTEKDSRVLLRVVTRSYHPKAVKGKLIITRSSMVKKIVDGQEKYEFEPDSVIESDETLHQGLNTFYYQPPIAKKGESYIYEAKFTPSKGAAPGDRPENNQASANIVARGERAVLLIESKTGDHELLVKRLKDAKSTLKIISMEPERLPQDPTELALLLSKFDTVILANVPAEKFTEQQQQVIRSNTHDQGCGLIMIGGEQSFGAGGWQNTEVEKALPVLCELKAIKVEGKGGLVLIMHASEIAQGNFWQKVIAKKAIEKLSPADMVGMIYWRGQHLWHIPFKEVGPNKQKILKQVDSMFPGDMPDLSGALQMALKELTDPKYNLSTKHIIFISDGDHWGTPVPLLQKVKQAKITVTTVCITSHGQNEYKKMKEVAQLTGGRYYPKRDPKTGRFKPLDPRELPAIFIKEARLVSKSFIYNQKFRPVLLREIGPAKGLPKPLENLYGFVRTRKRESHLVKVPIWAKRIGKYDYPILAYWQYGLGTAVAFTSDALTDPASEKQFWDQDWANSGMHGKFWEQVVEWSLRLVETGKNLTMQTEQKDGKIRVIVKVQDDRQNPVTDAQFRTGITSPNMKAGAGLPKIKFEQTKPGVYEAEIKTEEVGSYFIHVRGKWKNAKGEWVSDSVRAGVTISYSPEFSEMDSNLNKLQELVELTGGNMYADSEPFLAAVASKGEVFRRVPVLNVSLNPIWPWLLLLAAVCLFFDVMFRRIAFEPEKLIAKGREIWARLRGYHVEVAATPQFLDRLQTRKQRIGEEIQKTKAARRFEGEGAPAAEVRDAAHAGPTPQQRRPAKPAPKVGPEAEPEPQDYASRLRRAKQKVWKERDREH